MAAGSSRMSIWGLILESDASLIVLSLLVSNSDFSTHYLNHENT